KPLAVIRLNLDKPFAVADVVHPATGADQAASVQDARGERPIEAGPVEDGDIFTWILELRDATPGRDHEAGRWSAEHDVVRDLVQAVRLPRDDAGAVRGDAEFLVLFEDDDAQPPFRRAKRRVKSGGAGADDDNVIHHDSRSEEHTSELQSRGHLVCRLLLEKKKQKQNYQRKY